MAPQLLWGGVASQFKAFADATSELWCEQLWSGKIAAGFTCGSALNGDQSSTLNYLTTFANQHGMLWMGVDVAHGYNDRGVNRLGSQTGVTACSKDGALDPGDRKTAIYLGKRVASMAVKMK